MGQRRRGTTLLTALLVAGLALTLAFTTASVTVMHLDVATQSINARNARNAAEAAIFKAIAEIFKDPNFGKSVRAGSGPLKVTFTSQADSDGWVNFDQSDAAHQPCSINNLGSENTVPGATGGLLPGDSVQLIGVGRSGNAVRTVELVLYIPRFPYVVASSGPLRSTGGLKVAGIANLEALANGVDKIPADQLRPGHLASNALFGVDGIAALTLSGNNSVSGDVRACGDIKLDDGTVVSGLVRSHSDPVGLPQVPLQHYDPSNKPTVQTLTTDRYDGNLQLEGYARRQGDFEVTNGLDLKAGVLYVAGNLTIDGGLSGKGAVVVEGATQINGGGNVSADNLAALLSHGSVSLQGTADSKARFQGLVYTEGNLRTDYVQVAGVLVANNQTPGGSQVDLHETTLFELPAAARLSFVVGQQSSSPPPPAAGAPGPSMAQLDLGLKGSDSGPDDVLEAHVVDSRIPLDPQTGKAVIDTSNPWQYLQWFDSLTGQFVCDGPQFNQLIAYAQQVNPYRGPGSASYTAAQLYSAVTNPALAASIAANLQNYQPSSAPTPSPSTLAQPSPSPSPGADEVWSIDLSQFINVEDKVRVLVWHDI